MRLALALALALAKHGMAFLSTRERYALLLRSIHGIDRLILEMIS